jgi:enterobactin synthetase component D
MGQDRIPIWPIGFTGSISHTDHLATAVVGRSSTVQWLGIDIERKIREVTAPLIQQICCDGDELTALVDAQPLSKEQALTVIFSAKESLYKAITPRDQRLLGFRDLRVYSLGPQDVKVMLLKDLGAPYKQGMTWGVEVRHLPDDLVETLVLKGWDGGGRS